MGQLSVRRPGEPAQVITFNEGQNLADVVSIPEGFSVSVNGTPIQNPSTFRAVDGAEVLVSPALKAG